MRVTLFWSPVVVEDETFNSFSYPARRVHVEMVVPLERQVPSVGDYFFFGLLFWPVKSMALPA
jgi:hypothetical protein